MKKERKFPLGHVLSMTTGMALPPNPSYSSLMDISEFVIGRRNEASIDIPVIMNTTKEPILKQHPWLQKIKLPKLKGERAWRKWYKGPTKKYGKYVTLMPDEHVDKETIYENTLSMLCANVSGLNRHKLESSIKKVKKLFPSRRRGCGGKYID